jgi:uncharacterized protein YjcR
MRSEDAARGAMPESGDAERPLPDTWRKTTGAPKGNRNALKHGLYSAEPSSEIG